MLPDLELSKSPRFSAVIRLYCSLIPQLLASIHLIYFSDFSIVYLQLLDGDFQFN